MFDNYIVTIINFILQRNEAFKDVMDCQQSYKSHHFKNILYSNLLIYDTCFT